jgi:hypothetical protein
MRGQHRWISCDHDFNGDMCDEQYEEDGFIRHSDGSRVTWPEIESAAREDGWTITSRHLCPAHSEHKPW